MEKSNNNNPKAPDSKDFINTNNIKGQGANEKDLLDSFCDENKIIKELEKIDNKEKNERKNSNLTKSLSEYNHNNSDENKKSISIDSNSIFPYPLPKSKRIIVELNQLSQRVSKEENENESNNRIMVKQLRLKYFPYNKNKIIQNNYINTDKKIKFVNNYKLKNVNNINNIITNDKIEPNKKSIKPNLVLDSINDIKNNRNTTDSKKSNINDKNIIFKNEKYGNNNKLDLDTKNKFFIKILKQDDSYLNTIKPITKEELLSYSNEKEKIIFLLEKNRELINILRNINEKYKMLKSEYIDLYKSININNLNSNENDEYKNYLSDENKTLKIKLDNYENIFTVMTSYINDMSNKLNLKKINIIDLKNNININEFQKNTKNTPLNDFIHILNDNKKIICKYIEVWNNNIKTKKNKDKILNKIESLSNYEQNGKVSRDKILISRKDSKYKKKK
jgi:hypothetical protein